MPTVSRAVAVRALGRAIDQALARVPASARAQVRRQFMTAAIRHGERRGNVALGDVIDDIITDYGEGGRYSGSTFTPGEGTSWQPNPFTNQQGSAGSVAKGSSATGSGIANVFLGSDGRFSSDDLSRWMGQAASAANWLGALITRTRGETPSRGGVTLGPAMQEETAPPQPSGGFLASIPPVAIYVGAAGVAALGAYLLLR